MEGLGGGGGGGPVSGDSRGGSRCSPAPGRGAVVSALPSSPRGAAPLRPPPHSSLQPHRTAEWNGVAGAPGAVPPLPGAAGPAEGARAVLTHGPPRCRRGRSPRAGALRAGGALPSGGTGRCGEGHRVRRLCRSPSALSAPRHSASRLRVGALDVGVGGGKASPGAPRSPFGAVRPIGAARCRPPPPARGPLLCGRGL